jgi:hypothetical protein
MSFDRKSLLYRLQRVPIQKNKDRTCLRGFYYTDYNEFPFKKIKIGRVSGD